MTEQQKKEKRRALKEAAIVIIAEHGLENVTTKELTTVAKTGNEAYIYRLFQGKRHLLIEMFDLLDRELASAIIEHIDIMFDESVPLEERGRSFFGGVWHFVLSNPQRCSAYMQYYYSPIYAKYSADRHLAHYEPIMECFTKVFKPGVDVWRMANYMLDVILTMSIKIFRGEIEDTPEFEQKVFEWIFRALYPYLVLDN